MKVKKVIHILIIALLLCLAAGTGDFFYNALNNYKINDGFVSVPLQFNPDDSTSAYNMRNANIMVKDAFVKGIQKDNNGGESLVIRALAPFPRITVEGDSACTVTLLVENVNPDFYAGSIEKYSLNLTKVKANTLQMVLSLQTGEKINIEPEIDTSKKEYRYIILGDNRDGYETFDQIIQQVNGTNPLFVIDNGDLVYSGKPNQYRLFDQMISDISSTVCTTLGNHDIQDNGRDTYTMLYGPAYYSFDFANAHFIFLDSSPGWAQMQAVSEEQYAWLERDLKKAQGKNIYVITHIPPVDPRSEVTQNEIPNYVDQAKNGDNWVEQKLNNYNDTKEMDHGFQNPQETARFENLMSTYHVDTVYLSHIHSHLEFSKDGVRYLISGGAGAELLTKNSYYHYLVTSISHSKTITMVELPSPVNNYIARYAAAVRLFAGAMFKENAVASTLIIAGFILLLILLVVKLYLWKRHFFNTFGTWLKDIVKYSGKRFRELFGKRKCSHPSK